MADMFNAIMGKSNSDPYADIQLPSNQPMAPEAGTNGNDVLGRYLEQMRQRTVNTQALGGKLSPFQNALNTYDQFSGTAMPALNIYKPQPVRTPGDPNVPPPQTEMPTPSPLLQSNGNLFTRLLKMATMGAK